MPTSPRDLTDGTGGYQPTASFSNLPLIRPGLRPVHLPRGGRPPPAGAAYTYPVLRLQGSPPHPSRLRRATLSKQERAPHPARAAPGPPSPRGKATSGGGCIHVPRYSSLVVPSTPVPGFARSTLSKQERASPHPSRLRRATFPVGEGFLRRGKAKGRCRAREKKVYIRMKG